MGAEPVFHNHTHIESSKVNSWESLALLLHLSWAAASWLDLSTLATMEQNTSPSETAELGKQEVDMTSTVAQSSLV